MAMTRRGFLGTAGGVAAAAVAATSVRLAVGQTTSPNSRIGVGYIGCGGRSGAHHGALSWLKNERKEPLEFVAVCDVYKPRLERARQGSGNDAKAYMDYRDLIADPRVDLVCISTPDHHHAVQAIAALKAGKHVYVEKPVTHWRQFELLKELAKTAATAKGKLQCGTQGLSCTAWRQGKKLIQEGLIGQPIHAEAGYFRVGDWGERGMPVDDPKAQAGPDLDWEAFLGDSPKRPFNVDRFFRWRLFEDYAGGPVTDVYPHALAPVIHMLGVKFPSAVVGTGGIYRYPYELREVPDTFSLVAEYPEKISISVMGTEGNDLQGTGNAPSDSTGRSPVVRGWEGSLTFTRREIVFTPAQGSKKKAQKFGIEKGEDHVEFWQEFLKACRGAGEVPSPMDTGYYTQTALIMGMLAHRNRKTVTFDAAKEMVVV